MSKSVVRARNLAAEKQEHHCYYCGVPMWSSQPDAFVSQHRLSQRKANLLKCTAEHVVSRREGGADHLSNIVAACHYCNRTRHARPQALDALAYKRLVQQRVSHGRWLLAALPESLRSQARP